MIFIRTFVRGKFGRAARAQRSALSIISKSRPSMIDVYEQFMTAVVENDVREVSHLIENGIVSYSPPAMMAYKLTHLRPQAQPLI